MYVCACLFVRTRRDRQREKSEEQAKIEVLFMPCSAEHSSNTNTHTHHTRNEFLLIRISANTILRLDKMFSLPDPLHFAILLCHLYSSIAKCWGVTMLRAVHTTFLHRPFATAVAATTLQFLSFSSARANALLLLLSFHFNVFALSLSLSLLSICHIHSYNTISYTMLPNNCCIVSMWTVFVCLSVCLCVWKAEYWTLN